MMRRGQFGLWILRPRQDTITTVEPSVCSVVNVVQSFPSREDVMETIDDFPCWVFLNYSVGVVVGQELLHNTSVLFCKPFCKRNAEDGPKKGLKRSSLNKKDYNRSLSA
ncbi:hypothetical protein RF55_4879 [Lasius niger]|uniref:Uncharacterized protein n=1 Tax=Lasius niger TaxID=67767 RepID=A0A0J7KX98_LASNI|nr:hypothetical protein RF55_4879 [Lasius niger]